MALALQLLRLPAATSAGASTMLLLRQPCLRTVTMPLRIISQQAQKPAPDVKRPKPPPPPPPVVPSEKKPPIHSTPQLTETESDNVNWSKWPPPKGAKNAKATAKQKLSSEAVRQNVRGYIFKRVFNYITNYDKILEKNFPGAFKMYRTFVDGVKDFYQDMKRYVKISRIVNNSPDGLKALNRKELELYMQMPRDMVKVAPSVIGASLPIVGYAVLPLVFMFPKQCLSSHFWNLQQRIEFQQDELILRLKNNRPLLRKLQSRLKAARTSRHHEEFRHILGLLGSGFHPSVDILLNVKDIFAAPPYSLIALKSSHVKLLCRLHGIRTGWFQRYRLFEHAFMVHHMDLAIMREGGPHNLHPDDLRRSCFIRGLNPSNMNNEQLVEWMRNWIKVSERISEEHISLFLHLPILLAYNHPNNWQLIYSKSKQEQSCEQK